MKFLKYLLWLLPFVLPTYLIRLSIVRLPTTVLELYLIVLVASFTWMRGWSGWRDGWRRLAFFRWPILAWFVVSLISVFVAPDIVKGFGLWRAYVLEPLLVLVIATDLLRSEEDKKRLTRSLFLVVPLLTLWALFQFVTGYGISHPWNVAMMAGRRATGPFLYPNALALFVTPIAALAFCTWLKEKRNFFALSAWVGALLTLMLAKSDGGLIAWLVVAFIALAINRKTRWWTVGAVMVLLVGIIASPFRGKIWNELTFQGWSGQVRLFQWRETRQMLQDHWFWGSGFGGYPTVFKPYHRATAIEIFQYPHNILLNFWTETGLLGVLAFGWIIGTWVASSKQQVASSRSQSESCYVLRATCYPAIAPLLAILIHGLVDVPYFKNDLAMVFWLLLFVTIMSQEAKKIST
ncbi:O-antigen ligase family protein [Candidatus Uhrbacteria bacterium]|nr:O-antigen ligase family protein [Candidatus Uhrbacteria bacterium]